MQSSDSASKSNRVVGGHKAAMHNPNVSAEAKEHSRQVVEEIQGSGVVHDDDTTERSSPSYGGGKDENRVLGGYKATLKNPNVSDEAKERAEQILEDRGAL
ncbi:Conidiation protein 6-domain-containing protein [Russula aff. rugulosa BPL654]|nr:Conidiation protein 6-domain-containing protein [Russula aff. rugulosa BPL654]